MKRHLDYLVGIPLIKLFSSGKKKITAVPPDPKKILVMKLAAAGDTVLWVPVFRQLKQRFPAAEIHWLVSGVNVALAKPVPYVDRFWVWEPVSPFSFGTVAALLRKENFDVVIDGEQWARATALLSWRTGAPVRIGFDTPGQHRAGLYTHPIPKRADRHEIEEFFALAAPLIGQTNDRELELWETEAGKQQVNDLVGGALDKKETLKVVLHPGCGEDGLPREWPLENYAVLGHWLLTRYQATLFLTSGPEEKQKTERLYRLLNGKAYNLGGLLSWPGTLSLLKSTDALVSGNTGVMHLAAALKKPQVALHGPTSAVMWGPLNKNAVVVRSSCPSCPCLVLGFEYHRTDQSCMARIDVDEVKQALAGLFDKKQGI